MEEINVIQTMPHTHLYGYSVQTRIIRNGEDIGFLSKNDNYDFNYQQAYEINPPVKLRKYDELITKCTYSTKGKKDYTVGGESTQNEVNEDLTISNFF